MFEQNVFQCKVCTMFWNILLMGNKQNKKWKYCNFACTINAYINLLACVPACACAIALISVNSVILKFQFFSIFSYMSLSTNLYVYLLVSVTISPSEDFGNFFWLHKLLRNLHESQKSIKHISHYFIVFENFSHVIPLRQY